MRTASVLALGGVLIATLTLGACGGGSAEESTASGTAAASDGGAAALLEQQRTTVLDQQVQYPKRKPAEITSSIITLEPGQESGWRKHKAPVYMYVLEGTITVEYDAGVTQEFAAGSAFMQAVDVWYDIANKGEDAARVLMVVMGAKGVKATQER